MAENRITEIRKLRKLTQRALAEQVGTSQQQIQRIESGTQAVRLDLAVLIAKILEVPLPELFPKLPRSPTKRRQKSTKGENEDTSLEVRFAGTGIDPDPSHWTLKLGLTSGPILLYGVSSEEKDRISNIVWNSIFDFVVFDTRDKRVAVKRDQINFCQLLFDFGVVERSEEEAAYRLEVFFARGDSFAFGVEPDQVPVNEDESGEHSQLQQLFIDLDGDIEKERVLWFDDEDGERVYLPAHQLLRIEVPLICCEPSLWKNVLDNYDEDTSADVTALDENGKGEAVP